MHTARMIQLISYLEVQPPENFNMSNWFSKPGEPENDKSAQHGTALGRKFQNWCGTAACIAGHSNLQRGAKKWYGASSEAVWLGLSPSEQERLFVPETHRMVRSEEYRRRVHRAYQQRYNLARALNTLKHMVVTQAKVGHPEINWDAPPVDEAMYRTLAGRPTAPCSAGSPP